MSAVELPSVSLVVLNWNGREYLADCLNALLELDYPRERLQLILCDNGSTDGSAEYVSAEFPDIELVTLDRNHGFAEGNNLAVERATGEWVGFLNNDMVVPSGWLQHMVAPLKSQPSLACIGSRILNWEGNAIDFVGGGVNFQGHGYQLAFGDASQIDDRERLVLFACGGAMIIRRELFTALDGFDASYFAFFEDVDLGWRLNILGHDVWYTPHATAFHHHHSTAAKIPGHRLKVLYERNALATIYKCLDDANLAAALPASLLLVNEKALRFSHLDRREWELGFTPAVSSKPREAGTAETEEPERGPENPFQKVGRITREEGVRTLVRKGRGRVRWKWHQMRTRGPGMHPVSNVALAHFMAVRKFSHDLGDLTAKRRSLQAGRVRSDAEVLALVPDLITDPSAPDADYRRFHAWLCDVLGITARFAREGDHPFPID